MTEQESAEKAVLSGVAKAQLLAREPGRYWLRAIMAGLYLSLVVMTFWALHQGLRGSPFGKVIASAFFGVGLSVIVFTESELFTSNCFYLAISSFAKKTSLRQAVSIWVCSWLGNLLGAVLLAVVFRTAGVFESFTPDHALYAGAFHKADQSVAVLFWKGVLANWIVCLAVWVGLRLKEEIAKTTVIILVVFTFLYLGFEHSIANMGTFAFALVSSDAVTPGAAMRNLAVSTLGNLVGGAVLVGWVYAVLGRVRKSAPASSNSEVPAHIAFD
ncbi:MAG: formate/nitrite transporter family protein [Polyangiaceae bacterium]